MAAEAFDYASVAAQIQKVVREELPEGSFVGTEQGYQGHVHLKVVSERFRGKTEEEKQSEIWEMLREKLGPAAQYVSLALVYGPDEL